MAMPVPYTFEVITVASEPAPTMSTGLPTASEAGASANGPAGSWIVSLPDPFAAADARAEPSVAAGVPEQLTLLWTQKVLADAEAELLSQMPVVRASATSEFREVVRMR